MQTTRRREIFTTIHTEGAILPADLLGRIADNDRQVGGLRSEDYRRYGERLNEAISHSWNRLLGVWTAFQERIERLDEDDPAIGLTRERWLLPLFEELGYGRLPTSRSIQIEGKDYPISHVMGASPIHLVGYNVDLDRRSRGVAGAATMSPHGLVQEFLNRSENYLWGFVSNGRRLRVLRDNVSLTRQAYVEFDLEAMMNGEVYADFVVLWLLCHESRVEPGLNGATDTTDDSELPSPRDAVGDGPGVRAAPSDCWLEQWSKLAAETGTRVRDNLRHGVEQAINQLGTGFLDHPANDELRSRLRSGELSGDEYYRQLLRTVYRLLFLFVAEDRELLLDPNAGREAKERYRRFYSTRRLRDLARSLRGTKHGDLWEGLNVVIRALGDPEGCPPLALPALGSFLWSEEATSALSTCRLTNGYLLEAVRELAFVRDANVRRNVDYKNLGSQELGSVYESLLELHPELNVDGHSFQLSSAAGSERKTTGSYYTPDSLVTSLLDTALDPVLDGAARSDDPEAAILSLKVCDPAVGSGHFLIAAAHRIARKLASVRSGDDEPPPGEVQHALRDVISRCLYGVDVNPMAVELCKVSLWMEAIEPGKALSFLDHHIKTGNSLLGATPRLLADGIPDDAFKPIEGDDKSYVSEWRKRNREMRKGQQSFFTRMDDAPWARLGDWAATMRDLEQLDDGSYEAEQMKQEMYREQLDSSGYLYNQLRADAWCASFVWKKTKEWAYPITEEVYRRIERNPHDLHPDWRAEIERLARQYRFFYWHLAFPDVFRLPGTDEEAENEETGWSGGFDVVLGNPPWEKVKLQEREWFASRSDQIANASKAATRRELILDLRDQDPRLYDEFTDERRRSEGESHILMNSGLYPLCGRGDVNTYAVFAELGRVLASGIGFVGLILPSGIATDKTTRFFFQDLVSSASLFSLFEFVNRQRMFPAVQANRRFCLVTISNRQAVSAKIAAQMDDIQQLRNPRRHYSLSRADFIDINPNTLNLPTFAFDTDAEMVKAIYRRVPVIVNERLHQQDQWSADFTSMIHMTNDSDGFEVIEELEGSGWTRCGYVFSKGGTCLLPLYEAKLVEPFNHRASTFDGVPPEDRFKIHARTIDLTVTQLESPSFAPLPRYWLLPQVVADKSVGLRDWYVGFRNAISATADSRSFVACVLPRSAVGNSLPLVKEPEDAMDCVMLLSMMNSVVMDYVLRQKAGGGNLNFFILEQLPFLKREVFESQYPLSNAHVIRSWIMSRVLELTYTAWDLKPFARDCGYEGPPFRWDEERRFLLRCELDAAYFHLYLSADEHGDWLPASRERGNVRDETAEDLAALREHFPTPRDAVAYIMDTFRIVRDRDEAAHGHYRTKATILQIYDAMSEAMRSGEPYQTLLDPPPADSSLAHDPSTRPEWME